MGKQKHICTEFKVQKIEGGIRRICKKCKKVVREYSPGVFSKDLAKKVKEESERNDDLE